MDLRKLQIEDILQKPRLDKVQFYAKLISSWNLLTNSESFWLIWSIISPTVKMKHIEYSCILVKILERELNPAPFDIASKVVDFFERRDSNDSNNIDASIVFISGAPIFVFVHGGYWHLPIDKTISAFMVEPLYKAGVKVIVLDYDLCPTVSLEQMVNIMLQSLLFTSFVQNFFSLTIFY